MTFDEERTNMEPNCSNCKFFFFTLKESGESVFRCIRFPEHKDIEEPSKHTCWEFEQKESYRRC